MTTARAVGSRAMLIRFDRPWSVSYRDIGVSSSGWGGFVVIGADHNTRAYDYGYLTAPRPAGCTASDAKTGQLCPYGRLLVTLEDAQGRTKPSAGYPYGRLTYPAGVYRLYLLTGIHKPVTLRWRIPELVGSSRLVGSRLVAADAYTATASGSFSARATGTYPVELRGPGAVVMSAWSAARPNQVLDEASTQACLDTDGDTHAHAFDEARTQSCAIGGDSHTVGAVSSTGGGTSSAYDVGSWIGLRMSAGHYRGRYANTALGDHPATGIFTVWFAQA